MDLYLYEDILKAQSQDDLLENIQRVVEYIGYETFVYYSSGALVEDGTRGKVKGCIFGTMPDEWYKRYVEKQYEAIDLALHHCIRNDTPVLWTHKYFSAPEVIEMHRESIDVGIGGGASFPIGRAARGVFSLARDGDTDKIAPFAQKTLGDGMLLAGFVSDAVRRVGMAGLGKSLSAVTLTPRERECLLYAARGRTIEDIAKILTRSHYTIVFHLTNACSKLGAANRTEAVAIAISRGLIVP